MTDLTESARTRRRLARALEQKGAEPVRVGSSRRRVALTGKHLLLIVLAALTLAPVMLIVSTTFKSDRDDLSNPFGLFTSFSFANLANAWNGGDFQDYVLNSILMTIPATVLVIALSTLAGYAFARLPFRGRTVLFYAVVMGLLVPFFTYMIPLYFQLRTMGLLNTLPGVILVLTTTGVSFGTFFMRAFFTDLPGELEQAARIDGASEWQIFHKVMLPLVTSGMSALGVFTFLQTWNNFLVPLLYLPNGNYRPVTTGLYQFTSGRQIDIGPLAAATLITILPVVVVFVLMQRQVTEGFISGAVKG